MTASGPSLTLNTTSPASSAATYVSGNGTDTLRFEYVVDAGTSSSKLNYVATNSLSAGGGSITDGAGNNATTALPALTLSTSLGSTTANAVSPTTIVVDGIAPTVTSVTGPITGTYKRNQVIPIAVRFSEAVTVTDAGLATYQSGSGTTSLVFNYTVASNASLTSTTYLNYNNVNALALNNATIKDSGGNSFNPANALPLTTVAASLGSSSSPQKINLDGTTPASAVSPQVSRVFWTTPSFTAGSAGNVLTVSAITGTLSPGLTLAFASGFVAGTTITGQLTSTETDASPGKKGTYSIDVPQTVTSAAGKTTGVFKAGSVVPITVEFDNPVIVSGTPTLKIQSSPTSTTDVAYSGGSGTKYLLFNYTIQNGDTSSDLDYATVSSLSLAGSSIKDLTDTNNATLTLPTPGPTTTGSLSNTSSIVIDGAAPTIALSYWSQFTGSISGNTLTVTAVTSGQL
ncbi:MAG: hypothetical protein EBT09_12575, partial [Actinobacteria bacterium]|nr:hypothetical protein [Actinomycetota bacterium]